SCELQFSNIQYSLAACDLYAISVGMHHVPWLALCWLVDYIGSPNTQLFSIQQRLCNRPGIESAHLTIKHLGRIFPIDARFLLTDLFCVGNTGFGLRHRTS